MYGSRIALLGLLGLVGATAAFAETDVANAGRMALLAAEAAALSREAELLQGTMLEGPPGLEEAPEAGPVPVARQVSRAGGFGSIPARLPAGSAGGIGLGVLALAALAAYLATRARLRRKVEAGSGEVREVTWRFRSPEPIRIGGESAHRVAEVLDEIEQLGQQLRAITTAPRGSAPAAVETAAPAPSAPEPVVFARREPAPPAPEPVVETVAQVAQAVAPLETPVRIEAPPASRVQLREAMYAQARRLLRAGQDRLAVREATGLKLAEIDLLRCVRMDERAA